MRLHRSVSVLRRTGLAAGVALLLSAAPATAQTDARMVAAVKLAQDGLADSARTITRTLLTSIPASDTLYPQALFTAATVAATAPEMEKALRRIVVEYPTSEWVDDALLRLAQLDYAGGDVRGAAEKLERLKTDFPNSALITPASLWAARSYFELRDRTSACKWLEDGRARAGADVEAANQLAFYQQRCSPQALMADAPTMDTVRMAKGDTVAKPQADTPTAAKPAQAAAAQPAATKPAAVAPTPAAATPAPAPAASAGPYRLQLAAMQTADQAATLIASLKVRGIFADVTVEGGYHKVRTGRYPSRAAAVAALPDLQQKAGTTPFIVREST